MNIRVLLVLFLVFFSTLIANCFAKADDPNLQVNPERFYSRIQDLWCSNEKLLGCMNISNTNCEVVLEGVFSSCDSLVKTSLESALINAEENNIEVPQIPKTDTLEINNCLIDGVLSEQSIKLSDFEECLVN